MEEQNINIAIRLARFFAEETDLPSRLRRKERSKTIQKNSENSGIEQRFQDKIKAWGKCIEIMTTKIDKEQAYRFLNISPIIDSNISSAAYYKDFHDFTDYLILRRDKENCDDEELGQLVQLHTAF